VKHCLNRDLIAIDRDLSGLNKDLIVVNLYLNGFNGNFYISMVSMETEFSVLSTEIALP